MAGPATPIGRARTSSTWCGKGEPPVRPNELRSTASAWLSDSSRCYPGLADVHPSGVARPRV